MSTKSLIQWLETDVRRWGFDPQQLELSVWQEIYDHRQFKLMCIQEIRKELMRSEARSRKLRYTQDQDRD